MLAFLYYFFVIFLVRDAKLFSYGNDPWEVDATEILNVFILYYSFFVSLIAIGYYMLLMTSV